MSDKLISPKDLGRPLTATEAAENQRRALSTLTQEWDERNDAMTLLGLRGRPNPYPSR
jgi:hypothetical protein